MVMFLTDNIAKKADTAKQQKPHRFCSKKKNKKPLNLQILFIIFVL